MFVATDTEPDRSPEPEPDIEAWFADVSGRGKWVMGDRLRPTEDATTVRVRSGELLVIDGPRTKAKIVNAGITFRVPEPHRVAERTAGVLAVVYLVFNEGYAVTEGAATRDDLAAEAVRLSGLVAQLLPSDDEVHGLRALLLLQHARRATRTDAAGDLVPMPEQDRRRWDAPMVTAGLASMQASVATGRPAGGYRLQAQIAAEHTTAASAEQTDWARVVTHYDALLRLQPSPVVSLNRAVALGFRDGPRAGLAALAEVERDPRLANYHLRPATRADLLRRAGRHDEAAVAYGEALRLVRTVAERRFLERRIRKITPPPPRSS